MLTSYFKTFDDKLLKKSKKKAAAKKTSGKTSGKTAKKKASAKSAVVSSKLDLKQIIEALNNIIPSSLSLDAGKPIDSGGFAPEGVDLCIYKKYCNSIIDIMDGYVPYELLYGLVYLVEKLDKKELADTLSKVAAAKKLNRFVMGEEETTDEEPEESIPVPSFIIVNDSQGSLMDVKNDVINYYMAKSVNHEYEFDIMMVINKGLIVKNWREKRSYIAFETEDDTMMWFFILMNEYLDMERDNAIDFRKYIKKDIAYPQY